MKHLSVFPFLIITLGLVIAVPVPRAPAASPLDKLQDRLFGDRDDRKDKDKDKDRDRRRDDDRNHDHRDHQCFDNDRNGYCDSCRAAVANVRAHQCYDRDRSGHCDFCGRGLAGVRPVLQPHQCYDRDHSGYCDYCGRLFVAARGGAVNEYEGRSRNDDRYDVEVGSRRYNPARSVEAEVQAALVRRGYYGGPADGSVGPGTRKAIEKFQDDYKLDVTGRIDSALLRALKIDAR